ncbi:MAG: membrane dipeptidase [Bacteroidales bacterium]|nr:membrane dipeptidase [Bacteroidales bacterium]
MKDEKYILPDKEHLIKLCNDSSKTFSSNNRLPLIGVSANLLDNGISSVNNDYTNSIILAGGIPVVIPVQHDINCLLSIVENLDGLLLTGGGDIHPFYLNEDPIKNLGGVNAERDSFDWMLLKVANDRQIPIFGICRGHQLINAFFGGTLYQDIYSQIDGEVINHSQSCENFVPSHYVNVDKTTQLGKIFKEEKIGVNSFHHQAVKKIAPGFRGVAFSSDGINEAMESLPETGKSIFSVQWHPERMATLNNIEMLDIFKYFILQAKLFKECKEIHSEIITVDSHTDTPMLFTPDFSLGERENGSKVTLPKLEEGLQDCVFMVAYLKQGERDAAALDAAFHKCVSLLKRIEKEVDENSSKVAIAKSVEQIKYNKSIGKKSIVTAIENGYAIGKDLKKIKFFKDMGVRYITLSHNGDNDICDSAKGKNEHNGLSDFGKEVVLEMNRLGIMIDISHTSEKTTMDVLDLSNDPIIASHSGAKAICNHPRNLSDESIKRIASKGGVVQVCLYPPFVREDGNANIKDVIAHIKYIANLVGVEHVGVGSDFDGDGGVEGCNEMNEMINLTKELLLAGFSKEDIKAIRGANFLRVMNIVCKN